MSPSYVYSRNGRRHSSILYCSNNDYCSSNWYKGIQMNGYPTRVKSTMRDSTTLSFRFCVSIYIRRSNWNCTCQLFNRCYPSRHILRSSTFSLCIINGSCLRHLCRILSLISTFYRLQTSSTIKKDTLLYNVYRSKPNIFPTTFPRFSRNATTILRLSRRLHTMKNSFLYRIYNLTNSNVIFSLSNLRSLRLSTRKNYSKIFNSFPRMTIFIVPSVPSYL